MTVRQINSVVVFDLETTSTDPATAKIIEIGAVKVVVKTGEIEDGMSTLVLPEGLQEVPPEASAVNHITIKDLRDGGRTYRQAAEMFRDFCKDVCVLAAHNMKYDATVLQTQWGKAEKADEYMRKHICTMRLAQHLLPDLPSYSLQALRYRMLIDTESPHRRDRCQAHTAVDDALVAGKLLSVLVAKTVQQGNRINNLTDLVNLSWAPLNIATMPFGKHKGAKLTEVPDQYFDWCLTKMDDLDEDVRAAFVAELKRRSTQ